VATKPAEAAAAAPPKSKKLLLVVVALVLFVVLAVLGTIMYVNKQRAAAEFGDEEARPVVKHVQAGPPTYLPLDNMVVNLADPGGERVAQIGVTLELQDAAAVEKVKQYLPTIRSGILLLVSQRTSEDLLKIEGKEKLARDILREASEPFGGIEEDEDEADSNKSGDKARPARKRRRAPADQPVQRVLFSSFIVQ
jgi:flagellar FliL protein